MRIKLKLRRFESISNAVGNREKRSLGGILGVGAGIFSMIFSAVSTAQVSRHVKAVETDIQNS